MELTSNNLMSGHLLKLSFFLLLILPHQYQVQAHCYKSDVQIPALEKTKHIEISINIEKEIDALEESINQLDTEIVLDPPQTPLFLALLCLAGRDLSETFEIPIEKTLYGAYILPGTNFVLLAHKTGTAQVLIFDTFENLMKTKYSQEISPVLDPRLQVLTSETGMFNFVHHSTNPEKFHVNRNKCIQDSHRTIVFFCPIRQID